MTREKIHHLPERRQSTYEKDQSKDRLSKTVGKAALAAAGILLAGTAAMVNLTGCSSYESEPEMLDPKYETLQLESGAKIRTGAYVSGENDSNLITTLDETITVTNSGNIETEDMTDGNGTWFGVPERDFEKATGLDIKTKDGTAWINHQKANPIDADSK